jgi:hypothetical protein
MLPAQKTVGPILAQHFNSNDVLHLDEAGGFARQNCGRGEFVVKARGVASERDVRRAASGCIRSREVRTGRVMAATLKDDDEIRLRVYSELGSECDW